MLGVDYLHRQPVLLDLFLTEFDFFLHDFLQVPFLAYVGSGGEPNEPSNGLRPKIDLAVAVVLAYLLLGKLELPTFVRGKLANKLAEFQPSVGFYHHAGRHPRDLALMMFEKTEVAHSAITN